MSEPQPANSYAGRTTMCRNCGALVGAGETTCSACGMPAASVQRNERQGDARQLYDNETVRFARTVLARPATFTFVFVTFNVFIFLLMCIKGGGVSGTEDPRVLLLFGAKFNTLINQGEWWRLVTPVFLHIGVLHLFVNMYSLFMLGPYVERLYGSARFVFFWVATGVAGVAASYFASSVGGKPGVLGQFLFRGGDGPSAGASGALFGLVGVLFVFGIKFRHELPDGFKRAFGLGMLPTILINLVIGYTIPFIDNAAHIGGLAAGMLFALFVGYKRPGERGSVAVTWHALQIVALALVVAGFGEVMRHYESGHRTLADTQRAALVSPATPAALDTFIEGINAGQVGFHAALEKGDKAAADAALTKLDAAHGLDAESDLILKDLRILVVRARDYAALASAERDAQPGREARKKIEADFGVWEGRSNDWVKSNGAKYGIVLDDEKSSGEGSAPTPGGNQNVSPNQK
ncbi:MAG: rhomboid family intramembrane serine protease [Pyrinomonadaceae bacterium]